MTPDLPASVRLTPDQSVRNMAADEIVKLRRENRALKARVKRLEGAAKGAMAHLRAVTK